MRAAFSAGSNGPQKAGASVECPDKKKPSTCIPRVFRCTVIFCRSVPKHDFSQSSSNSHSANSYEFLTPINFVHLLGHLIGTLNTLQEQKACTQLENLTLRYQMPLCRTS